VVCNSPLAFASSIVWTPVSGADAAISGCNLSNVIAGPAASGGTSSDPLFANPTQSDYHLTSTSPAIDLAQSGPATDIAGTARPQGLRFDLGAFEYKP
jgi:hypothetical protein